MDRRANLLITAVAIAVVWGIAGNGLVPPAQAAGTNLNVNIGLFYDRLAPYGDWREHPRWGWVWSPHGVAVDWRPYTLGRWVYTDDYGWTWESDEDWGWACDHYGRWDWDDNFGWFWVPGSYWGPAWVAWRTGPDFIGWCPLPPPVRWRAGVGLDFGGFDLDDIPPWQWVFVETRFFDAPRIREHLFLSSRSVVLVRESRVVVRFESFDGRIVNRAFPPRQIEEFTHRPVTHFRVRHVDSPSAMRLARERDGEIAVFGPRIQRGPAGLRPPGPGEWERRQNAERSQLQEQQRAEQSRQQERHRAERATPGFNAEQLQRRQEAERQALQSEHERQQHALENRQMRQRDESGGPDRFAGGPEQRGRGTRR
jgi:hypothetical protein